MDEFIIIKNYPNYEINDPVLELEKFTKHRAVVVYENNKEIIFESSKDAVDYIGVGKTTLHYRLKNTPMKDIGGIKIRYYSDKTVASCSDT